MTKEPKLVRARQIPEWDSYDQEVARLAEKVASEGGQGLVGSVDDLAADKSAPKQEAEVDDEETKHLADEL